MSGEQKPTGRLALFTNYARIRLHAHKLEHAAQNRAQDLVAWTSAANHHASTAYRSGMRPTPRPTRGRLAGEPLTSLSAFCSALVRGTGAVARGRYSSARREQAAIHTPARLFPYVRKFTANEHVLLVPRVSTARRADPNNSSTVSRQSKGEFPGWLRLP